MLGSIYLSKRDLEELVEKIEASSQFRQAIIRRYGQKYNNFRSWELYRYALLAKALSEERGAWPLQQRACLLVWSKWNGRAFLLSSHCKRQAFLFELFRESVTRILQSNQEIGVDLSGIDLSHLDLSDSMLISADFTDAVLVGVNFRSSAVRNARFDGSNLSGAKEIDFDKNSVSGAKRTGHEISSWSTLAKNYTRMSFVINLIFLLLAVFPNVLRLGSVLVIERALYRAETVLQEVEAEHENNSILKSLLFAVRSLDRTVNGFSSLFRIPTEWGEVIGKDRLRLPCISWPLRFLMFCALLYQYFRWGVTKFVRRLVDEERRTRVMPSFKGGLFEKSGLLGILARSKAIVIALAFGLGEEYWSAKCIHRFIVTPLSYIAKFFGVANVYIWFRALTS